MEATLLIIILAPLVGAIIAGFGWPYIGERAAEVLTTVLLFLIAGLSWILFLSFDGITQNITLLTWFASGDFQASWGIRLDRLTLIMLIVVTTISALTHLYSMGYMAHDPEFEKGEHYKARFFAYISLFTFAMLMLATSNNLLQLFFGWEGVGLSSYLLINFYFRKPSANAAGPKAFIVNRIGDFGFILGIFALYRMTGSVDFDTIFTRTPELARTGLPFLWGDWNAADLIGVLLFIGAMGKSAQLFLHTWLPDAMEGPTPISALIHAATMVTAGVFLVSRMSPLYQVAPFASEMVLLIGATTAFFAATIGIAQNDIKRVIAYSTVSQLGYMFAAAGAGVYNVAMFHLMTHAFFKGLLFLAAGSVITAMHHEQDMRNYGGLRKKLPITYWTMVIATLAITGTGIPLLGDAIGLGIPIGFAGFDSKDAIIESTWGFAGAGYSFWLTVIAAVFTALYSWRLIFMTFHGTPRGDRELYDHARESPATMTIPLIALAFGAAFSGMVFYNQFYGNHSEVMNFFGITQSEAVAQASETPAQGAAPVTHAAETAAPATGTTPTAPATTAPATTATTPATAQTGHAVQQPGQGAIDFSPDNHVMETAHAAPLWVKLSAFVAMLIGTGLGWWFYIVRTDLPAAFARRNRGLYQFLLNKWYFDELYDLILVKPAFWLGRVLWRGLDDWLIDKTLVEGLGDRVRDVTARVVKLQSGYVYHYAFAMLIGVAALVTWAIAAGGLS